MTRSRRACLRAGLDEVDVTVVRMEHAYPAPDALAPRGAIDATYRLKYARQGSAYVTAAVSDIAAATTLRSTPLG